ncbi:hypothetical protein [Spirilliplanes yamanashiensis]|uniref:Uncharacterized protein n=1 Tax=Spirilliplanes yamanashiensis TaxID=42233 RepID=A0A8J3YEU6_9ACTN|nr:hypothetical protein [Spirilliplanes yamanashiensis]MDP9818460.1 hypothetical protein [Spirilliplanes yamanashiensis]GIJ06415.1 hypothetical protein Sya03_57670 [Spirilliplanes yamanashiensis]
MRLAGVRTSTGAQVTLLFVDTGVHVLATTGWRHHQLRIAGGAVFAAAALAAAGLGVRHAVDAAAGAALAMAALALAAAAAVAAVTAWWLTSREERALRRNATQPDIIADQVTSAQSAQDTGAICVTLHMADNSTREFSARGLTGVHLGHQFGQMFGVANPGGSGADPTTVRADRP